MVFQLLVYYCKGSVVTILDKVTKAKKSITLSQNANEFADSISVGNKLFLIGGYPACGETYQ